MELADTFMRQVKDDCAEAAVLKSVLSQISLRTATPTSKKNFLKVVMPSKKKNVFSQKGEEILFNYCNEVFFLKRDNTIDTSLIGDTNFLIIQQKNGIFFHIFSDQCHYAKIHHRQDPLYCYFLTFLHRNADTTEYSADAAVIAREAVDKFNSLTFV